MSEIEFDIRVREASGRSPGFVAYVVGERQATEVRRHTRGEAVVALGETLDDTEVPL